MKLDERIRPILENIAFTKRYKQLSLDFSDLENKMKSYSNDEVIKISSELGHALSYNRKENFFKLLEREAGLEVQLNISLKYGLVELILGVVKDGVRLEVGGPFGVITRLLGDEERIKYPAFKDYDQLREILRESFAIYDDIKNGLSTLDDKNHL